MDDILKKPPLTPVMTADELRDTSSSEKRSRRKDLMMKSCSRAPVAPKVRMLKLWDLAARMPPRPLRQTPNSHVQGWRALIKAARHSKKNPIVTHSQQPRCYRKTKVNVKWRRGRLSFL